jgi:hypothetical protein
MNKDLEISKKVISSILKVKSWRFFYSFY